MPNEKTEEKQKMADKIGEKVKTSGRNGEIDFLRFVFCLTIVGRHLFTSYDLGVFTTAAIGVEFFFIVSGYLMAKSAEKMSVKVNSGEIGTTTWSYVIRKTKSFFPYYIAAMIFQVIVKYIILDGYSISKLYTTFMQSIPSFTLTFMGFANDIGWYVQGTWFLSSLLIASFILYPFLIGKYDISSKIMCPLIAMFIIGYSYITVENFRIGSSFEVWNGICLAGTIRAISEMSLGVGLYPLSQFLQKKYSEKGTLAKVVLTLIKVYCYLVVFAYVVGRFDKEFAIYILMFLAIGIALSFSELGYSIQDSKFTRFLGKVALPIYIFHGVMRHICVELFPPESTSHKKALALTCAIVIICIGFMYLTDFIMRLIHKKQQVQA